MASSARKLKGGKTSGVITIAKLVPSLKLETIRSVAHDAAGDAAKRLRKKLGCKVTIRVKDYGTRFDVTFSE